MTNSHPDAVDAPAELAVGRDLLLLGPALGLRHRLTPNWAWARCS
jgi:hypothetical protein